MSCLFVCSEELSIEETFSLPQLVELASVSVEIAHTWMGDLQINITDPNENGYLLLNGVGGSDNLGNVSNLTSLQPLPYTFSNDPSIPPLTGVNFDHNILSGEYQALTWPIGGYSAGNWTIVIVDAFQEEDSGCVGEITITAITCQSLCPQEQSTGTTTTDVSTTKETSVTPEPSLSLDPSQSPSKSPTMEPSLRPSVSQMPSGSPSNKPSLSSAPSSSQSPSSQPSISSEPSESLSPSGKPSESLQPSQSPSSDPTAEPDANSDNVFQQEDAFTDTDLQGFLYPL